jgi:hypothetical protein
VADDAVAERVRLALELNDLGVRMYAQRLRREQPAADEAAIVRQVNDWLGSRSFDAPGHVRRPGHESG